MDDDSFFQRVNEKGPRAGGENIIAEFLKNVNTPKAKEKYVLLFVRSQGQQLQAQIVHCSVCMREASTQESRIIILLEQKIA